MGIYGYYRKVGIVGIEGLGLSAGVTGFRFRAQIFIVSDLGFRSTILRYELTPSIPVITPIVLPDIIPHTTPF